MLKTAFMALSDNRLEPSYILGILQSPVVVRVIATGEVLASYALSDSRIDAGLRLDATDAAAALALAETQLADALSADPPVQPDIDAATALVASTRSALILANAYIESAVYDLAVEDEYLDGDVKHDMDIDPLRQSFIMQFNAGTVEGVPETQAIPDDIGHGDMLVVLNQTGDTVYLSGEIDFNTDPFPIPALGRRLFFRVKDGYENGQEVLRWVSVSLSANQVQTASQNNALPNLQAYLEYLLANLATLNQSAVIQPQSAPSAANATAPAPLDENVSITLITQVAGVQNSTNARVNLLFTREAALATTVNSLIDKLKASGTLQ